MTRRTTAWAGIALFFLIVAAYEAIELWRVIGDQQAIGVDLEFYRAMGERWLADGTFYTDRQLSGPYTTMTLVDNLYPPAAVFWFVPLAFMPAFLWWVLPAILVGYVVWRLQPAPWAYAAMAAILAAPKTPTAIFYGNSDMWVAAAVAAGVLWGWPAILILMKPSFAPLALIGVRRRSYWVAAGVLAALNIPLIGLWVQYPTVMINSTSEATYSLFALPMVVLPLVAWAGSRSRPPLGGLLARFRRQEAPGLLPEEPASPPRPVAR